MTAALRSLPRCLSSSIQLLLSFLFLLPVVSAAIPQTLQHTNLLRTLDLTKPYVRDSTALILENISNTTQTEYYWGIPLELVPALSYLEVKEKKSGNADLFPVEPALEDHSYAPPPQLSPFFIQM
jgi:Ribophorin I